MTVTGRLKLACVIVAVVACATWLDAQGRGGQAGGGRGAGAPRAGGPPPGPRNGTLEHIMVHGKSLEGNLEGDSPDRDVTVYLPPTYADAMRRFPVVYLLHGYGGRDDTFTQRLAHLQQSGDQLSAAQGFSDLILVMPNAYTLHKGSMYSNSPTTGDWEKFIAEDLVSYIDSHYRTIADRKSRGIAGHSMGGYGALRIGMKRADVFFSLYAMSACCLTPNRNPQPDAIAAAAAIKTREDAEKAASAPGFGPSTTLASAAAWSPNPKNPPLFLDLPVKDGKVRQDVIAKWVANSPIEMLDQYAANLTSYYAIAIDVGTKDTLLATNRQLHDKMTKLRIPHAFEEYDGDHTNRIAERIELSVLPFFSKNLVAPANPTSPLPPH